MRLLVVEDDPHIAQFLVKGLREAGFAVDYVADGEAALHRGQTYVLGRIAVIADQLRAVL